MAGSGDLRARAPMVGRRDERRHLPRTAFARPLGIVPRAGRAEPVRLPARSAAFEFVNWDDPSYITENAQRACRGCRWRRSSWALTTGHSPYWHPLTWLSHLLDVSLFGLDAGGHHVTNLVLHAVNTLLLFGLLAAR